MTLVIVWTLIVAMFGYSYDNDGRPLDRVSIQVYPTQQACQQAKENNFSDGVSKCLPFEK